MSRDPLLALAWEELDLAERTQSAVEVKVAMARFRTKRDKPITDDADAACDAALEIAGARVVEARETVQRLVRALAPPSKEDAA